VDIHLNPKIGADWQLRWQQKRVVTPGQNEKYYLAGTLHSGTGKVSNIGGNSKDRFRCGYALGLSAPSTGLSASSVQAAISAFPAWVRSSIYRCTATGSGSPLLDTDFQQGGADVHSDGFYQPLRQVALLHGSGRRRFSQPHRVSGYALLLYSLHSCPLRAF
jgi:hypothetical protein